MTPDETLTVHALAQRLRQTAFGGKAQLKSAACAQLSCSLQTLHLMLKQVGYDCARKQRSDKGASSLTKHEVDTVAASLMAATRRNGKRTLSMGDAAEMLRASGAIKAERVDQSTGEITPMSAASITRALKKAAVHPSQLNAPTPHVQMRYKGANHVWQVDASICVVFYMPTGGATLMDEKRFYKNKPAQFEKVKNQRCIRYVMTDCFTGCVLVRYYSGAETQANLLDFIIWCMLQRSYKTQAMPMHGLPEWLADDAGSANGAHTVTSLLNALNIKHHTHAVGNARASGSVESAQNIVETKFEHKLTFVRINNLDELNAHAEEWLHAFNARRIHSRHKQTRYSLWQTIKANELRLAPPEHILRSLPTSKIETRVVSGELTISFALGQLKTATYNVAHVPSVLVGQKVEVQVNPFECHGEGVEAVPSIRVRDLNSDATDWTLCQPVQRDEAGYRLDAPVFGEGYKSLPDTQADINRKRLNEQLYGEADARKVNVAKFDKRKVAFDGAINPFALEQNMLVPSYLPRAGTESELQAPNLLLPDLTWVEAAKMLKAELGDDYSPQVFSWLTAKYPDNKIPALEAETLAALWRSNMNQATGTNDVAGFNGLRSVK